MISDLALARRMRWRYEWVQELDADVYDVLVDELTKEPA